MNEAAWKWVESLRSGRYAQGTGFLCCGGEWCCLGVGADLFADELGVSRGTKDSHDIRKGREDGRVVAVSFNNDVHGLPKPIMRHLGLREPDGGFTNSEGFGTALANINDKGTPFAQIADIIESEPAGLFV